MTNMHYHDLIFDQNHTSISWNLKLKYYCSNKGNAINYCIDLIIIRSIGPCKLCDGCSQTNRIRKQLLLFCRSSRKYIVVTFN